MQKRGIGAIFNPAPSGVVKCSSGIRGLDEITQGGYAVGRVTLFGGGGGTGKTLIALQALVAGAQNGEPGIFVAFEESAQRVVLNASSFGWNLPELEKQELFFLDARPRPEAVVAGEFDLTSLLASLSVKVRQMGAKRIVFDSIDVLLSLLDSPLAERRELHRLHDWLCDEGLTGFITSKNSDSNLSSLRYQDFMQYMVDCVILLKLETEQRISRRTLRVMKYRGSGFYAGEVAMSFTASGVEVVSFPVLSSDGVVSTERISTGVPRLDTMLDGGYYRASSVLITGAPGTAKTSLAGAFLLAACQRGERSLYVGFDEAASEAVRNLRSINIDLAPHVETGLLQMVSMRSSLLGAEEHIGSLRRLIELHRPQCLVIDPMSAVINSDPNSLIRRVPEHLIALCKHMGVTVMCTALSNPADGEQSQTTVHVSTVADTWIDLKYRDVEGESNRSLRIVKARGTAHSKQLRELLLSDQGITLADVYFDGSAVLMGTARLQREADLKAAEARTAFELAQKRLRLEQAKSAINNKMEMLMHELADQDAQLAHLQAEEAQRLASAQWLSERVAAARGRDESSGR